MNCRQNLLLCCVIVLILSGCSLTTPEPTAVPPAPTHSPTTIPLSPTAPPLTTAPIEPTAVPPSPLPTTVPVEPTAALRANPLDLVSQETLFAYLEDLTAIQAYSGWRNSASTGEAEAIDYVTAKLEGMDYLQDLGLELERQSFHVYLGAEIWESRLHLTVAGQEVEVPADAMRGHRDNAVQALRNDSDGVLNDSQPNPVQAEGPVVLVRSIDNINRLGSLEGQIALADFALFDYIVLGITQAVENASRLLQKNPAGVVLITQFTNRIGESHGTFVGDGTIFSRVTTPENAPILYARLEDLGPAGISSWDDLARVESARMTWDADVFSPGTSENLVARIPGADPSQAIILSAHIDSPNSPGAMDDGSGSVVLLEVARVLNEAHYRPDSDLYLVWYGSEELGLYGASHFVNTHQELLDRTLAMLQIDCLTRPLDGISSPALNFVTWSAERVGDGRLLWTDLLLRLANGVGIYSIALNRYYNYSDNGPFGGYAVPNADLIYMNEAEMNATGSLHYAGHIHDPYDTIELAREMGGVLEQMAVIALAAALETATAQPDLRVAPKPSQRAVFIASHTEAVHMTLAYHHLETGMLLSQAGFDADLIPYGQPVTAADIAGAALVVALPAMDYPSPDGDEDLYDEAWSEQEIAVLQAYVEQGGLLVLTNSAHRLKYSNAVYEPNEDWPDANALAETFGVSYQYDIVQGDTAYTKGTHPLLQGFSVLELAAGNGVPFSVERGQVLAEADGETVLALVEFGGGEVLAMADLGLLNLGQRDLTNLPFWKNLARYALER